MDQMKASGGDRLFQTPILFMIFSRPDTTFKVFEVIRSVRPAKLFIAADGPRAGKEGEAERCHEVRKVATMVDWPCEVHTLFRDENLGCGRAVSGAITWFFDHVPEGIILEDDTYPSMDFFRYCEELLDRYRHDTRIMAVAGSCLPSPRVRNNEYSYFFSNWDYVWGWATWKRAWDLYDYSVQKYERVVRDGYFHEQYTSLYEHYFMKHALEAAYYSNDSVTWWDYQWGFARKINSGLAAVPTRNMVVNLGLGNEATNTTTSRWDFLELEEMEFPLRHPEVVMHDRVTDDEVFRLHFTNPLSRVKQHLKRLLDYLNLDLVYKKGRGVASRIEEKKHS